MMGRARMRAAPPSTGLRTGFDTLLREVSQLLRMLSGERVGIEAEASESSMLSRPEAVSKDVGAQGRRPLGLDQVVDYECH